MLCFKTLDWGIQLGFILMAFPCDRFGTAHCIGGSLAVGGLWAFTAILLFLCQDLFSKGTYLSMQAILHATALFCAINFFFDTALKGFSQRPILAAMIAEIGICLHAMPQKKPSVLTWRYKSP